MANETKKTNLNETLRKLEAAKASRKVRTEIESILSEITNLMDDYRAAENNRTTTWGEVGNLEHTCQSLKEIRAFLKNEEI